MVEYAHRRWHIEEFHEGGKSLLGWDDYQGRLWTGFHRQATIIMLTYSFLRWQEWHQRQQAPRWDRRRLALEEIHQRVIETLWNMVIESCVQQKIAELAPSRRI